MLQEHFGESLSDLNFNLSYNQGSGAGQTVPHVHCWVIVRTEDEADLTRGVGLAQIIDRGKCGRFLTAKQWEELSILLYRVADEREDDRKGPGSYSVNNAQSVREWLFWLDRRDKPKGVF